MHISCYVDGKNRPKRVFQVHRRFERQRRVRARGLQAWRAFYDDGCTVRAAIEKTSVPEPEIRMPNAEIRPAATARQCGERKSEFVGNDELQMPNDEGNPKSEGWA